MKKIAILTSLLALMACGGGGGGSGTSADRSRPRDTTNLIVPESTYNSNHKVTSMVSRLLIARDGSGHSLARSGSTIFAGAEYDEYDLSDVDFNLSDEGFGGIVKFGVDDDKKIINFSLIDDDTGFKIIDNNVWVETENGEVYLDGNELKTNSGSFEYDSDTGIYTYTSNNDGMDGTFKIVNGEILELYDGEEFTHNDQNQLVSNDPSLKIIDGKIYSYATFTRTDDNSFTFDGKITVNGGEEADATLKYVSAGKNIPLRYSDFGYFELTAENENENRPVSIIGGYDRKKIDHENLPSTENALVFSGGATGSVVALKGGNVHTLELNDNDAEITFANGTSTLNADFTNWYDVQYSETYAANGDVTNKTITYSNYNDSTTDRNGNAVSENYFRLLSDTMTDEFTLPNAENTEQHGSNIDHFDNIQSDVRYYGDNGTPSEVVGLIQVRDCAGNQCGDNDEVRMNIGFGGKRDVPTQNPRRD